MKKKMIAGAIGLMTAFSALAAPLGTAVTAGADVDYSCDFTLGGSYYVEQQIAEKYGDNGLELYRLLVSQVADYAYNGVDIEDKLTINIDRSLKVEYTQGSAIIGYVFKNNPQFYWLGNSWSYGAWRASGDTDWYLGSASLAVIDEYKNGETRRETSAQLAGVLNEYHEVVEGCETVYDKLMAVNDKIDADTEYVSADDISHRTTGCLLRRECVCEGYSKAFQLICNREGLGDNVFVEGIGYSDGKGGSSEAHGWNLVNFDGDWYYVDSTWNDIIIVDQYGNRLDNSGRWHDYFMKGSSFMEADHDVGAHLYSASETTDPIKYIEYPKASPVDLKAYLYADSMTLGEGMEYNAYYEIVDENAFNNGDFTLDITIDGTPMTLEGTTLTANGRDLAAFKMDIPVKNIADRLYAAFEVRESGSSFIADSELSPRDYLTRLYNAGGAERRIAAAALNYAAAAQVYKDYNTGDIANGGISADDRITEVPSPEVFGQGYTYSDEENGVKLSAASLDMLAKTRIKVYFTLDSSYASKYNNGSGRAEVRIVAPDNSIETITVNGAYEKLGLCGRDGDLYWVETSGIDPDAYDRSCTIQVYADGENVCDTLSYSVYDYFRSKCTADTGVEQVVAAMYEYGLAAADYKAQSAV